MEISLKRSYGYYLIFEADNVRVEEDIESREYPKDENGKIIVNLNPKRDIQTDAIQQFVSVLDDMIYYREADFDSSDLIERLFTKLPLSVAVNLADKLSKEYQLEEQN